MMPGHRSEGHLVERMTLSLLRLGFLGLSAIAPRATERKAAKLFATPRRRRKRPTTLGTPERISFKDGALAAWQAGPAQAPLVLLVHGWQGDAEQFNDFAESLLEAGLRVVRFDHPGHGRSTGKRATILDFRDAVLRVAEHFGPVHAVLGHSLGGTAAVLALGSGLSVERVVLVAPGREPSGFLLRAAEMLGLSAARRDGMIDIVKGEIGAFVELDIALRARERSEPALVIHARDDGVVPFEDGAAIAQGWSGAQLLAPAGLGHRRILRDTEVIQAAVEFVGGAARAVSSPHHLTTS